MALNTFHISYIKLLGRKGSIHADVSDITPGSVNIEINELKENLIKIENINTLLLKRFVTMELQEIKNN